MWYWSLVSKYTLAYRPVSRQRPRNKHRVQPLLCHRRINELPFLGNGSVNLTITIEKLLEAVFSVGSTQSLYNEDPRPTKGITEKQLAVDSWQLSVGMRELTTVPHGRPWQENLSAWSWRIFTVRSRCRKRLVKTAGWKMLCRCCSELQSVKISAGAVIICSSEWC
jgi:hypothetical protein